MSKGTVGWIARVIGGFQDAISNRSTRLRQSLIETGDHLIPLVYGPLLAKKKLKKLTKKEKDIYHFCRQWKANRKKLK